MEISVSLWSFNEKISTGELSQFSAISAAKELGFDNIEFTELIPPEGTPISEHAKSLKAEADRLGMKINCYAIGANMVQETDEDDEKEIERICRELDNAKILGAPVFRHDAIRTLPKRFPSFEQALPKLVQNIRKVTEYGKSLGIKTMVENHGKICQDSYRVEKLFAAVNHENFGLLVDMGNFMCADEQSALAVSRCAPYAFHLHAKDFHFAPYKTETIDGYFRTRAMNQLKGAVIGEGVVPVEQCFAIMKEAGYSGGCTIEFEGSEPCMEGIAKSLKNLKEILKKLDY